MSIVPSMKQISNRGIVQRGKFQRGRMLLCSVVLFMSLGCDDRRETATADSTFLRDLTLAGSETTGPSLLGDTSRTTPSAAAPAVPAAPGAPAASRTPAPASERAPARTSERPPAHTSARAPVPRVASASPAPAPAIVPAPPAPVLASGTTTPGVTASGAANAAAGNRRALGSGTTLTGKTDAQICSLANRPGDRFVASLVSDVTGPDGARIPAGTPILVELSTPSGDSPFAFRVKAVQVDGTLIPIEGTVRAEGTPTERRVSKGGDKGKVATGAIAGAILGRVLGGGTKGTVIGAAGGAAAGTIAAARNSVTEYCLPAGATLTVTLSAPLILTQGVP